MSEAPAIDLLFHSMVNSRLAEMARLRRKAELPVDVQMPLHLRGLDAIGAMIDEQRSLPCGPRDGAGTDSFEAAAARSIG